MTNIVVPELGESVVEARVAKWLKKEGDRVEVGEPVVELETEKIDLEVNAERGGVIASIKHQVGDDVKIGELLAVLDDSAGAAAIPPSGNGSKGVEAPASPAQERRATPTARRIAEDHDVNLASIQGSGAAGRVMKHDVEKAIGPAAPAPAKAAQPPSPQPAAATRAARPGERHEDRQRMSKRRATIARRLVEAQHNAAMLTTFNEIDMSAMMALRERRKEAFKEQHGVSLGIASFFVKAAVAALRAVSAAQRGDRGRRDRREAVLRHRHGRRRRERSRRARAARCRPDVVRGARARDSRLRETRRRRDVDARGPGGRNLHDHQRRGVRFADEHAHPQPPAGGHSSVLHKIQDRPVAVDRQVTVRPMMYVALSYDHRIVDGREAVQFLVKIKEYIEDPGHLLLES
jgi:2-oxoglutarate dehydrogenase E2 component (dihydrolipoamide succinyltransferase)